MRRRGFLVVVAAAAALAAAGTAWAVCPSTPPITKSLTGSAEAPAAGDSDGAGTAKISFDVGEGLVCWSLNVKGITPATAAHIHKAASGVAGAIVVPLSAPATGGSKGCTAAGRALIRDIIANPAQYYVNVHTKDFPAGALRAQLG